MINKDIIKELNGLFGSYRAEWLKGKIYDLFAEPSYFTALQDNRPCVLEGGRGTGKTTVLRGLSYIGQYALHNNDISKFDKTDFIGIYHRVNTNHVRAFIDGGLSIDNWKRVFAHYFNLIICRDIIIFMIWHSELNTNDEQLPSYVCELIAKSFYISEKCSDIKILYKNMDIKMYEFQSLVNNICETNLPSLSIAGVPIQLLTMHATSLVQFKNKMFYILIDEYENFEDYQQQIMNTLIKHNTENYTFKIGVRELGWRIKHTLNPDELLHDPADYVLINIERKFTKESHFSDFAKRVCQQRISQIIRDENEGQNYDIEKALKDLTIEDEAILLGIEKAEYMKIYQNLSTDYFKIIKNLSPLYRFFIAYWAKLHNIELIPAIKSYQASTQKWNARYENYKYEILFKIRKGRGKSGIQKYYTGWNTFIKLAHGNIRYLMELVYRTYERHLSDENKLQDSVSYENQTLAAQEVGEKNLTELEGLWKNGAQLTKLLLGFGRVFNILASTEVKSAPEINQFSIENSESATIECKDLIRAAVMNLALVRSSGNKLGNDSDTRDYIYMMHPIFSPYFIFSYRKKRKIIITQDDIMGIIKTPNKIINSILWRKKIPINTAKELPIQLNLFEGFYNDK